MIRRKLLTDGVAAAADFVEPQAATEADLLLAHDEDWVRRLRTGTLDFHQIRQLEVPYSQQTVDAYLLAAGGSVLASELALRDGVGFNLGGGFHHAFAGHGEGFCAINDIAVAVRSLLNRSRIKKALIVDCDVHHGNGTAGIFAGDTQVFTLSIHQYQNYPSEKPPSTLDIHLPDGVGDDDYLERLAEPLRSAIVGFRPDLLFYVSGADPYEQDQLGGLNLSVEGLKRRDGLVVRAALEHHTPVAIVLAGGYAAKLEDTIAIHANTAIAAAECLAQSDWPRPAAAKPA